MSKSATKEATTRYAQKFSGRAAMGHFGETQRLRCSPPRNRHLPRQPDAKTDESYTAAAVAAVESGSRDGRRHQLPIQRSERSLRRGHQATCRQGIWNAKKSWCAPKAAT